MSWKQTATWSVPSATAAPLSAAEPSTTSIWRLGRASRSCAIAVGTIEPSALGNAPARSVSRSAETRSATCSPAWASRSATASAWASTIAPTSVGHGTAGAAVEQPDAELALERGDLLGDGRLGQGERLGRARERVAVRDLAEGEHPARVDRAAARTYAQLMSIAKEVI